MHDLCMRCFTFHIFINLPFTSVPLLFKLLYLGVIRDPMTVFASVFNNWKRSINDFAI